MRFTKVIVVLLVIYVQVSSVRASGQARDEHRVLLLHLSLSDKLLSGHPPIVIARDEQVRWEYSAERESERHLSGPLVVRIFRGSKAWLIQQMPRFIVQGCVDYSPVRLPVATDGLNLSFYGLDTAWFVGDSSPQVLTLVFESSDPGEQSSLRLRPDKVSIANYFNSGVEIELKPPAGFRPAVQVLSGPSAAKSSQSKAAPITLPPCHVVQDYAGGRAAVEVKNPLLAESVVMKEVACGL